MNTPQSGKATRNLRALLALGFILAFIATTGGGFILALGSSSPNVMQPLWKFGQYVSILGALNLAVYLGLWWQVRLLRRHTGT
jgi:hypothetical protein